MYLFIPCVVMVRLWKTEENVLESVLASTMWGQGIRLGSRLGSRHLGPAEPSNASSTLIFLTATSGFLQPLSYLLRLGICLLCINGTKHYKVVYLTWTHLLLKVDPCSYWPVFFFNWQNIFYCITKLCLIHSLADEHLSCVHYYICWAMNIFIKPFYESMFSVLLDIFLGKLLFLKQMQYFILLTAKYKGPNFYTSSLSVFCCCLVSFCFVFVDKVSIALPDLKFPMYFLPLTPEC